jgi:hypothetical protein
MQQAASPQPKLHDTTSEQGCLVFNIFADVHQQPLPLGAYAVCCIGVVCQGGKSQKRANACVAAQQLSAMLQQNS